MGRDSKYGYTRYMIIIFTTPKYSYMVSKILQTKMPCSGIKASFLFPAVGPSLYQLAAVLINACVVPADFYIELYGN